jgi:hypothetical protein
MRSYNKNTIKAAMTDDAEVWASPTPQASAFNRLLQGALLNPWPRGQSSSQAAGAAAVTGACAAVPLTTVEGSTPTSLTRAGHLLIGRQTLSW